MCRTMSLTFHQEKGCNVEGAIMDKVRLCVIGAGYISRYHLETFRDMNDVSVAAICNRGEEKRKKLAGEFSIPHQYADYHVMLKEQKLDAVLVCVSVENMASVILDCIPHKIPMLVEKPVALSVAEAEKIAAEAKKHGTRIMVGCNRRFISTILRAKEESERLGSIQGMAVKAHERITELMADKSVSDATKQKWIYANGIHCIDLIRFFAGSAVKNVASASRPNEKKYDALITFSSGIPMHYISYPDIPAKWTITMYCKQAKVTLKPLEQLTVEARGKEPVVIGLDDLDKTYKPGFFRQNRYFIDCVKSGKEFSYPACNIDEALEVMKLIGEIEGR